ncbi:MAG: NADH-quinone oxidoreductase subunit I [Chloroherpetonaceae bacterium]|nr:NADH-quinone oxidoreductase subunit I [Chloroherpetonaceae bacterium]
MSSYFGTIKRGAETVLGGLKITIEHFARATKRRDRLSAQDDNYFKQPLGLVTIQYPSEAIPTPPFSRYRLHNDSADCIACDQCARACPVQCITIKSFKATPDDLEELGTTSDGSKKKLWLEQFDIDMAKCMYCGYCTYPCPTECLTMTPVHDFSEFDRSNFIYHFGVLTKAKAAEKRAKLAKYEEEEKAKKAAAPKAAGAGAARTPLAARAAAAKAESGTESAAPAAETPAADAPKPAPKLSPMMAAKLAAKKAEAGETAAPAAPEAKAAESATSPAPDAPKPAPKLSPMMQKKLAEAEAKRKASEGGESNAQ